LPRKAICQGGDFATNGNFAGDSIFAVTVEGNFAKGGQLCQQRAPLPRMALSWKKSIYAKGGNSTEGVDLAKDSDLAVDGNFADDSDLAKAGDFATKGNFAGDGILAFTAEGNFAKGGQLCQGEQLHHKGAFAKNSVFAEKAIYTIGSDSSRRLTLPRTVT
jgi:hypothetical protein